MKNILLSTTAFAIAASIPGTAYAQDAGDDDAENTNENVIIVTATRRAQDVQDIPIAVTAVTPEQLEKQGVVNVQDIAQVSPSFSTSNAQIASGSVVLRIRGVGTTSNNIGFESAVGIFVDGAYQSRPGIALSEFVDIERVEVLRGPQGTLFGRNTSAGALNITTVRPDLNEFGGFGNASYGNYNLVNVQGAVNVPIIQDSLALRVTGSYRDRDGYVDVVDRNGALLGESNSIEQYLVRAQLGYESESGIRGRLIFDYSDSENNCCAAVELLAATLEPTLTALGGGTRGGQGDVFVTTSPTDQTGAEQVLGNLTAVANQVPMASTDQWGVTGELEFPLGDNADLIFIGSYRDFSSDENYDSDFTGLDVFDIDLLSTNIETYTAELRVQGEAFDGRFNWLVGGYYSNEKIDADFDASLGADYDLLAGAIFGGAAGPAPLALFTGASPNGTFAQNDYTQDSESYSFFTHNSFEIIDGLTLTAGLRYSNESKTGGFVQQAVNNPTCDGAIAGALGGTTPAPLVGGTLALGCFAFVAPALDDAVPFFPLPAEFNVPFDDDELIYTGKVTYEFAAPITAYASFTHGYKSGGINLDITAATGGADPTFRSELVDAYEIGVKAQFLDDAVTMNIAAFIEDFTDFQVLEFTGAQFTTFNVDSAKSSGVELESVIRPDRNLSFNVGLTYTDARYPGNCDAGVPNANVTTLCGNSLTNAPDIVAILGVNYDRDFGNYFRGFFSGQARTESDRRTSTQARTVPSAAQIAAAGGINQAVALAPLVPFDVQDGNTKVNLRAGIGAQDESWTLEVWGVNVTDVVTRGVTFNTVLRGNSRSAFPQQPATYGVTVRTKF
ncbi:TonB-dependent receptor [Sphingomonadaceae bacterium]|nr:TonB-dependent receptor [Sphingomonadaceae bacterium]